MKIATIASVGDAWALYEAKMDSIVEIAKIAVPVALGAIVWAVQTLAQRAWNEFETRRNIYLEVIGLIDSLFVGGPSGQRSEYLRSIRKIWIVGTDEVVRAANDLSNKIKSGTDAERAEAYSKFIKAMRNDIRRRRWLPPSGTKLEANDFPIESASS